MSFLFGGAKPTQSNTMKSYARQVQQHIRSMQREDTKTLQNEKVIIRDIRKHAETFNIDLAKIKAKELVRSRAFRKRLAVTQQGLSCLVQELSIMQSSQHTQEILDKTTKILQQLNSKMDIKSTYKMLMEFEKQNTTMSEKQDILDESMDSMFETDDSMIDQTMSAVFEELGLKAEAMLQPVQPDKTVVNDMDIEERLMKLRAM
jgi:charged multivesicular body protein 2A